MKAMLRPFHLAFLVMCAVAIFSCSTPAPAQVVGQSECKFLADHITLATEMRDEGRSRAEAKKALVLEATNTHFTDAEYNKIVIHADMLIDVAYNFTNTPESNREGYFNFCMAYKGDIPTIHEKIRARLGSSV